MQLLSYPECDRVTCQMVCVPAKCAVCDLCRQTDNGRRHEPEPHRQSAAARTAAARTAAQDSCRTGRCRTGRRRTEMSIAACVTDRRHKDRCHTHINAVQVAESSTDRLAAEHSSSGSGGDGGGGSMAVGIAGAAVVAAVATHTARRSPTQPHPSAALAPALCMCAGVWSVCPNLT